MARDTNFYYSFLVLTPRRRRAIVAVWDFCRAVDDAVDEARTESEEEQAAAMARLDFWRREIERCFSGATPKTPQGRALVPFISEFDLPQRPLEDLVDGVAMDIGHRRYRTFGELYQYCYRVAATVGLVCVQIFGCEEAGSRDYAVDLGVALQLTNILRDVKADLARGRLYIPLEDLARHGVTENMLAEDTGSPAVRALLRDQGMRARSYYQRATRNIPRDEARRLVAAEIMSGIYQAILAEIERRDFDVFGERIRVSRPRRALIALRIWAKTMFGVKTTLTEAAREVGKRFGGPLS
ncbi:MAG TPA: presqualene diphosphate synthase HpnD [Vicinamibacterales bacterium]